MSIAQPARGKAAETKHQESSPQPDNPVAIRIGTQRKRLLFLVMVLALAAASFHCAERRPPQRWYIPNNYTGWLILEYNVVGAPPLPQRDGYLIIRPGPSGKLRTSTGRFTGWAKDEFYYASPESMVRLESTEPGGGGLVWGSGNYFRTDNDSQRVWDFHFIGSEQAYSSARQEGLPEPPWPEAEAPAAHQ